MAKVVKYTFLSMCLFMNLVHAQEKWLPGIHDSIRVKSDMDLMYAVFIPEAISLDDSVKVLYVLEPAARVALGIQTFREVAIQYHFVVVCSYQSKNGPISDNLYVFESVMNDLKAHLRIANPMIYLAGFSGGSRAAFEIATKKYNNVKAVIACGAGLPPSGKILDTLDFSYVGIIGLTDMNFYEMYALHHILDSWNSLNSLFYFYGGHEWPPSSDLLAAFGWLHFQSTGLPKNQLEVYLQDYRQQLFYKNENYELFIRKEQMDDFLSLYHHITDLEDEQNWNNEVEMSKDYKHSESLFFKLREVFLNKQAQYLDALKAIKNIKFNNTDVKDKSWWESEIRWINGYRKSKTVEKKFMGERLYDFLWRMFAEQGSILFAMGEYQTVILINDAWKLVQPESYYPNIRSALCAQEIGDNDRIIEELKIAIKDGMTNKEFLLENFKSMSGNEAFIKLINNLN